MGQQPIAGLPVSYPVFDMSLATSDINTFILIFFRYSGQLGNVIFVVCSSWFLLEKKKTNYRKIFEMIADVWLISVIFLCVYLAEGWYQIPLEMIIKCIFRLFLLTTGLSQLISFSI